MKLIDLLYGRNHNSIKGKLYLRNRSGDPVTVTKEIRYTVTDGQSTVHIMVTMICPNTAVLLDIPIFLTKQYERRNLIPGQLVWLLLKNELKFLIHPTIII